MSSEVSRSSGTSSKLSQFGIYRTIDARTEEFLKLSRRRQIRQGCACAAISTTITVIVVVVILVIYEYAIVDDSSVIQTTRWLKYKNDTNKTHDKPFAEKLDRSYFGFDQDYFEQMPLLVNAMQESTYIDPSLEGTQIPKARFVITNFSNTKPTARSNSNFVTSIRRTSPRPFIFEQKHPKPVPFSKTYGSRTWVESYRNAQRLKNLRQVIKYLETTINAKFGDLYTLPTSTIAFSGVYIEPKDGNLNPKPTISDMDLFSSQSSEIEMNKPNRADPLQNFKPKSPGDVNLLADGFFRFAPNPTASLERESVPMFRQIKSKNRNCNGNICNDSLNKASYSEESKSIEFSSEKPKAFGILVNLFPFKHDDTAHKSTDSTMPIPVLRNIYSTTSRPAIQFRRKSTAPIRRITSRTKRPLINAPKSLSKSIEDRFSRAPLKEEEPKMIVHVNLYSPVDIKKYDQTTNNSVTTTTTTQANFPTSKHVTDFPILASTQVEDYHVGSSGIIPVNTRLTTAPPPPISTHSILPIVTTPFFNHATTSTEFDSMITPPTEIIKFSQEDAKVPDQYKKLLKLRDFDNNTKISENSQPEINRRTSYEDSKIDYIEVEPRTLIVKLKTEVETTTKEIQNSTKSADDTEYYDSESEESDETTTVKTYVPQINGHYRSINQNSRNINNWLNNFSDRKQRLAMSVSGFRSPTYVPQYVEIKRNSTRNISEESDSEDESSS